MSTQAPKMFRYQGRSMWPCFQPGDLLEYRPCSFVDLQVGDCVVYRTDDQKHVTHRVVAKSNGLITRGDSLPARDDEPVTTAQVVGKVIAKHRFGQRMPVKGGWSGALAGYCYRYAGRIDPQRDAVGGRVARLLRTISMIGFKNVWDKGGVRTLSSSETQTTRFWVIGSKVVGRENGQDKQWQIAWPWSILVRIGRDGETSGII